MVELDERWRALQSFQGDKLELFRLNCESELFLRLCDVDSGPVPKTPGCESGNGNASLRDERRVIWKLEVWWTEAIDGSFLLLSAFHKLALNGLELELSAEEDNLRF